MKDEAEPITDDEWLLRRVHLDRFRTDKVPLVSPGAFEPRFKGRDPDTTGISLYRADGLADPSEALATVPADRGHEYAVVRIPMSLLKQLKLSARIEPDEPIKGPVVIPELNANDFKANKTLFTPKQLALAEEASKDENIVRRPPILEG
jgi:hypothetical protein